MSKKKSQQSRPSEALTHNEFRSYVCLICCTKGSSMSNIQGVNLQRIQMLFIANYDLDNQKLPCALCSLIKKKNGLSTARSFGNDRDTK